MKIWKSYNMSQTDVFQEMHILQKKINIVNLKYEFF